MITHRDRGQGLRNPAGLVVVFVGWGYDWRAPLYFLLADTCAFLDAHNLAISQGVISLDYDQRKSARQKKIGEQGFPPDLAIYKTADDLTARCGLQVHAVAYCLRLGPLFGRNNYVAIWQRVLSMYLAQS